MINIHIPKGILVYLKADADSTFTQIAATPFLKNKMKHRDSTVEEWPHAFSTSTLYRSGDLYDPAASLSRNSTDMRLDRMDWPQIWRLGVEGYCCIWSYSRHSTLARTPLDKGSDRRRHLYLTKHNNHNRETTMSRRRIRTRIPGKPAAAEPNLKTARPLGRTEGKSVS